MSSIDFVKASKTISYALRHKPENLGLVLDQEGWCDVEGLLGALSTRGLAISREQLEQMVAGSDKQRFAFSADGLRIRANQGHTTADVKMQFKKTHPPKLLFHGTVERSLPAIFKQGLLPMKRHHVHLSADLDTATRVGSRRGEPVLLEVRAGDLALTAVSFYLSENGVWLVDAVPPAFLRKLDSPGRVTGAPHSSETTRLRQPHGL